MTRKQLLRTSPKALIKYQEDAELAYGRIVRELSDEPRRKGVRYFIPFYFLEGNYRKGDDLTPWIIYAHEAYNRLDRNEFVLWKLEQ